jgi:hypothetical protein
MFGLRKKLPSTEAVASLPIKSSPFLGYKMTDLLIEAQAVAANGFAVFPLMPRSKKPLGGRGFLDATTNALQIENWWQTTPQANIGIATGRASGVFVLDKNGGQRGTSKREDVLDSVLALSRPKDYRSDQGARFNVCFEKARAFHGRDAEAFEARYEVGNNVALWSRSPVVTDTAPIVFPEDMTVREAAKATGVSKSTAHRMKKKQTAGGLGVPASHIVAFGTVGQFSESLAAGVQVFAPP